jgi:hypothetical protein
MTAKAVIKATGNRSKLGSGSSRRLAGSIQDAGLRRLKGRGRPKVGAVVRLHVEAYNLIRITSLLRNQCKKDVMS